MHKYLFEKEENSTYIYNPKLRPVKRAKDVVNVDIRLGIRRLFEVDETSHRINLFAVLITEWNDEILKWNPQDFANITYTYVNYWKIWTPQITQVSK